MISKVAGDITLMTELFSRHGNGNYREMNIPYQLNGCCNVAGAIPFLSDLSLRGS